MANHTDKLACIEFRIHCPTQIQYHHPPHLGQTLANAIDPGISQIQAGDLGQRSTGLRSSLIMKTPCAISERNKKNCQLNEQVRSEFLSQCNIAFGFLTIEISDRITSQRLCHQPNSNAVNRMWWKFQSDS
jgi:hypothetical protein